MKIGIDARFYGSIVKGLGRYTQKLIQHLEQIDNENQYVIFLRKENFDEYQPLNKNFQKVIADYSWYSFSEQLFFPFLIYRHKLDLMHFPHFNVPLLYFKKYVITIHDLILVHFPTLRGTTLPPFWYWIKYGAYKLAIRNAIERSEKIITVSQFSKNDIISQYPTSEKKISVTYEACDEICRIPRGEPHKILEKYGIIKPYLLYVGNAYPHKNLEKLIDAFEKISKENSDLILALIGKEDYFYARLKKIAADRKISGIHFLGYVPDQDLDVIYRFAQVYVFPSLYEGFGLPPLEAMAKGTPVVCSDHPCMKEILGDAAMFADATDEEKFAAKIKAMIDDRGLRQQFVKKGYAQVKRYNWQNMAKQTLDIYQSKFEIK